jgi:L,D-transpeptidase YcbB
MRICQNARVSVRAYNRCAVHRTTGRRAALLLVALSAQLGPLRAQTATDVGAQIGTELAHSGSLTRRTVPDHGAGTALRAAYATSSDAPLWSRNGRMTPQAAALLHELQGAENYGLRPEDYGASAIGKLADIGTDAATPNAPRWARFDIRLSSAALFFMSDLHYGRVSPAKAGFNLQAAHQPLALADALLSLAHSNAVPATLAAVEPPFHHYALLRAALPLYLKLAQHPELTRLPTVTSTLKPGDGYAGAAALRHLLSSLGDLPSQPEAHDGQPTYDAELGAGVRSFQQRHGLPADGLLGKATFAALTTPLTRRVRQIDLTLERWRWLPPFQSPPIIVNIPQFRLFAFRTTEDRAADILQMDVIVGRTYPKMQTPVFDANMSYVVIRPYWDVPASITVNELLPKLRANPGYLNAQRLQIVRGQGDSSPTVPLSPQALADLAAGRLRLRQLPGEDNALGLIKFMFPNSYSVYLHSTPAHRLFEESVRTFSHGCIRVKDPLALATLVLQQAPGDWTREKIAAAMAGNQTIRVNLTKPINVLILYGTALATEAGPVLFFSDIYGYDRRLEQQLGLPPAA